MWARAALTWALALSVWGGCREPSSPEPPEADARILLPRDASPDVVLLLSDVTASEELSSKIKMLQREMARSPSAGTAVALGHALEKAARESFDPGVWLQVEAASRIALSSSPGDRDALLLQAGAQMQQHRFAAARDTAQGLTVSDPKNPSAWALLGDALCELGEYRGCGEAWQRMVDLAPGLPSYVRASYTRWVTGDLPGALELGEMAVSAGTPTDPEPLAWALTSLGEMRAHAGDRSGALRAWHEALALVPEYPMALGGAGKVLSSLERWEEAESVLKRALKGRPLPEQAWTLGEVYLAQGKKAEAEQAFTEAERLGRLHDPRCLALFLATRNRNPSLALALAESEARQRDDLITLDALAWARFRLGDFHRASQAAEKGRTLGTPDSRLLYHQAAIAASQGRSREARRGLETALARNPYWNREEAEEARKLLKRLGGSVPDPQPVHPSPVDAPAPVP